MITDLGITAAQCRAARALIEWTDEQLAKAADVDLEVVRQFEARFRWPPADMQRRIRAALEEGGVIFIPESGGTGAGARLKLSRKEVRALSRWEAEGGSVPEDVW